MKMAWLLALFVPLGYGADVCNPATFPGAYGFLLSGATTISGESKPVVSVARLVFDNSGKVSGMSSVNFAGLLLGNPVTGEYTVQTDCSLTWKLQDDSGNFQNFAGKLSPDGKRIVFTQSDPGSPQRGAMVRTAESCVSSDFRGRYRLVMTGSTVSMDTGRTSGKVSINGALEADGNTGLRFTPDHNPDHDANHDPDHDSAPIEAATYKMEGGCFVQLQFTRAEGNMNFRAVIVNDGKELLGIQSDAGATVTLRITSQ